MQDTHYQELDPVLPVQLLRVLKQEEFVTD